MLTALSADGRASSFVSEHRRGFTLIECLVVIVIIGLLVGLLLPAVQAAREAGRRMQCAANLRQIGMAVHNYRSAFSVFPTSQLYSRGGSGYQNNAYSELTFILPFAEQKPLYDSINFDFAEIETGEAPLLLNHTARNTKVAIFLCPSDSGTNLHNSYRFNRGRFSLRSGGV